jgi:OOP family OmpA-OmpF porin
MQAAWERYVKQLDQTPGIAVLDAEWRDGRFHIAGLRDPLAPDPDVLLAEAGLAEAPVTRRWTAYQALHPQLVLARAGRVLAPPASVSMALQDGVLKLSGRAPNAWIREASLMARGLAGIERADLSTLEDSDLAALKALVPTLEEPVFFFLADRQNMWPGQERKFNAFLEAVRRFEQLSRRIGMSYVIEIRGHAPASGDTEVARQASLAIAERFYARLQQGNVNMERFTRHGAGGDAAPAVGETDARRREAHVSFLVREAE